MELTALSEISTYVSISPNTYLRAGLKSGAGERSVAPARRSSGRSFHGAGGGGFRQFIVSVLTQTIVQEHDTRLGGPKKAVASQR